VIQSGNFEPNANNIWMLAAQIEQTYHCQALHVESVFVDEQLNGKPVWTGTVEVFALANCHEATRCFAWVKEEQGHQCFVAVLQKGFVMSPETAVKGWLASKVVIVAPVTDRTPRPPGFAE